MSVLAEGCILINKHDFSGEFTHSNVHAEHPCLFLHADPKYGCFVRGVVLQV